MNTESPCQQLSLAISTLVFKAMPKASWVGGKNPEVWLTGTLRRRRKARCLERERGWGVPGGGSVLPPARGGRRSAGRLRP